MAALDKQPISAMFSDNRLRHVGNPGLQTTIDPPAAAILTPQQSDETAKLKILLNIEADIREAANFDEWKFVVANETRKLVDAEQIFVFKCTNRPRLAVISGLTKFERSTSLASDIELIALKMQSSDSFDKIQPINLLSVAQKNSPLLHAYPYQQLLWAPLLSRDKELVGALIFASTHPLGEHQQTITKRLSQTYSHAMLSLNANSGAVKTALEKIVPNKWFVLLAGLIFMAVLAFPVSMSVLAPFEVGPRDATIVAAPLEGVISDILVKPNEIVKMGQPILAFEDTVLNNRYELAEREVRLAAAQVKKASQLAFDDSRGQQEVRAAMANHALKVSTQDYARQMLDRTVIHAARNGTILYTDRNALIGKPVKLGERILQIADPANTELLIDIAVDDAIMMKSNARVKVFLDSDPVNAREASIDYFEYQARTRGNNTLSFRAVALLNDQKSNIPRLGVRGTAKLYGEDVPMAFYLFRRPLSTMRQWLGI